MSFYAELISRYEDNNANLAKIEDAAERAVDAGIHSYEYAVTNSYLDEDGVLQLDFASGQTISRQDIRDAQYEAQKNFDEKFAEIIKQEYPELKD